MRPIFGNPLESPKIAPHPIRHLPDRPSVIFPARLSNPAPRPQARQHLNKLGLRNKTMRLRTEQVHEYEDGGGTEHDIVCGDQMVSIAGDYFWE